MKAKKARRKPGRPLAAESRDRHAEILKAARLRFAKHGYDGTTLSAVAADVGITVAALYYYVEDKSHLYRLVFSDTISYYWEEIQQRIEAARPERTFSSQLSALVDAVHEVAEFDRNDFMAGAGIEARRHPEFLDLTKERDLARDPVLASLMEQSLGGGSLADGDSAHHVLMLRIVLMGWALEYVFNPEIRPHLDAAFLDLAAVMDRARRPSNSTGGASARKRRDRRVVAPNSNRSTGSPRKVPPS